MLVDTVTITIKAGNGGNGAATFLRNGQTAKGGPDGGNGGNGGNIYFQGSNNITDLRQFQFQKKIFAEDGVAGKRKKLFGKNASHKTIYVPLGTHITNLTTGETVEVVDLFTPILLAKGGHGGRGNTEFKSATNQTPKTAEEGTPGEEKIVLIELKIIADIGLVGLPNAGKSSVLKVLTNAKPKIGDYPFTTVEPNIGMFGTHAIADIPGLIEGAASGKGLGVMFLKHIEKTKMLLHCIAATDEDVKKSYETVRLEFEKYNSQLGKKKEVILITKTDLVNQEKIDEIKKIFTKTKMKILTYSYYNPESITLLTNQLQHLP